jgi:hypothetical protein
LASLAWATGLWGGELRLSGLKLGTSGLDCHTSDLERRTSGLELGTSAAEVPYFWFGAGYLCRGSSYFWLGVPYSGFGSALLPTWIALAPEWRSRVPILHPTGWSPALHPEFSTSRRRLVGGMPTGLLPPGPSPQEALPRQNPGGAESDRAEWRPTCLPPAGPRCAVPQAVGDLLQASVQKALRRLGELAPARASPL